MEKNHRALDTGGGRDVKTGRDLGLGRFQAQPKWEIPVSWIRSSQIMERSHDAPAMAPMVRPVYDDGAGSVLPLVRSPATVLGAVPGCTI